MSASSLPTPGTPSSPARRSLPTAEVGYLIQLVVVAALPLVNAVFFDWDAGMVAGLLVVEALTVQLCLPLGWIAVDALWHRQAARDEAERDAAIARGEEVRARTARQVKRATEAKGPWRWWKAVPSALFLSLFVLAFGGLLPVLLLSVLSPAWLEWGANGAVTAWGVPRMLAFFCWPLTLAVEQAHLWPSYLLSVAMIVLAVVFQFGSLLLQGRRGETHPSEMDDSLMFQLGAVSVPLFIMSGIAHGVGAGFSERRVLTGALEDVDPLMVTLVVLMVLRSAATAASRLERRMATLRASGDAQAALQAGNRWLATLGVSLVGFALIGAAGYALSEPRRLDAAERPPCESTWTGAFAPASAALAQGNDAWMADPAVACERLRTATTLRLTGPIDPEDLDWFTGVVHLELRGDAVVHAADLDRLPSLRSVQLVDAGAPIDARVLRSHHRRRQLTISRSTVVHADALWSASVWQTLVLEDVRLERVEARRGRASVEDLVLTRVTGEVEPFLWGALGVRRLRLVGPPLPAPALERVLWLERLELDPDVDDATWCELVQGRYRIQSPRAQQACGHRFSMPP